MLLNRGPLKQRLDCTTDKNIQSFLLIITVTVTVTIVIIIIMIIMMMIIIIIKIIIIYNEHDHKVLRRCTSSLQDSTKKKQLLYNPCT